MRVFTYMKNYKKKNESCLLSALLIVALTGLDIKAQNAPKNHYTPLAMPSPLNSSQFGRASGDGEVYGLVNIIATAGSMRFEEYTISDERGNDTKPTIAPSVPGDISGRINSRTYPSIFQAWGRATNLNEPPLITDARHDLIWGGPDYYNLEWDTDSVGGYQMLAKDFTSSSIAQGLTKRQELLNLNPNIILMLNIIYRDAEDSYLPPDHEWWLRDSLGNRILGWSGGSTPWYLTDLHNASFRAHIVNRVRGAITTGIFDGVLLDWWANEDGDRIRLLDSVRAEVGDSILIIVNPNDNEVPLSAPFINGLFMETGTATTVADWNKIEQTLRWAEANVLEPRINCLEGWYENSRNDLDRMRAITTLSLTRSDGYCLFSEPNSAPGVDHKHDWYSFWDKTLGRPTDVGVVRPDNSITRQYENGIVLYNPLGNNPVTIEFNDSHTSLATGNSANVHQVSPQDGDIFIPDSLTQTAITFAVIGDYGTDNSNESKVSQMIDVWNVDFIITAGDNNYPDGQTSTIDDNIGKYYRKYIDAYQGGFPGVDPPENQFFPSLGNHDWHQSPPAPYLDYFTLPGADISVGSVPSGNERYYDFIIGPVHFYAIDSDTDEPDGTNQTSAQAQWLEGALSASVAAWQIVYFHHAAYSSSSEHGSTSRMQWSFEEWGADAIFQGHDHTYERIHKDDNGDGVIVPYFVTGNGGAGLYGMGSPVNGSQFRLGSGDGKVHGSMKVVATADSIRFEEYTIADASGNDTWATGGTLRDSYTIISSTVGNPMPAGPPRSYILKQNFPNPFNYSTVIAYDLPKSGLVKLVVYNLLGQEVAIIVDELQDAGTNTVTFDASSLESGVYFYKLEAGGFVSVKKMILLK